jgi:hypothetical protein
MLNIHENVHFLVKTQNFHARCGKFSHEIIFFLCSKLVKMLKYSNQCHYQVKIENSRTQIHPIHPNVYPKNNLL